MQSDLSSTLLAIVVFQLLLLAFFLLFSAKGKKQSNRLLGVFFLMVGISMLDMWLSVHGLYAEYVRIAFLDDGFILALGPIILFYTRSVMYEKPIVLRSIILHLIPFFLVTFFFLLISIFSPYDQQRQVVDAVYEFKLPLYVSLIGISFYIHSLVYLFISYVETIRYRRLIRESYSSISNMNVNWLDFSIKSLGALILIAIVQAIAPYSSFRSFAPVTSLIFIGFLFYFANRVILKGLLNPHLFMGIIAEEIDKYSTSRLTPETIEDFKQKLMDTMHTEKPFLDPELTINQLSKRLDISSKELSQVINQSFEKSFYDFINGYRIKEAQDLIDNSKDPRTTIQEVMYASGFNSKSSFYTFFKKVTGMTPSQFRNLKN